MQTSLKKTVGLVLSLVLGVLAAVGAYSVWKQYHQPQPPRVELQLDAAGKPVFVAPEGNFPKANAANQALLRQGNLNLLSFQEAIDRVGPSIVNVYTISQTADKTVNTYGSGVVLSNDGYIVTNYHVIAKAREIAVTNQAGTIYRAKLVGSDQITDLAVLKVDANDYSGLPQFKINDTPPAVAVGDVVLAIGNPLNLGQSATMGIVSALGRSTLDKLGFQHLIQTDVALNTGNSGGALINTNGELIGINTLIVQRAYNNSVSGLGFAIPTNTVMRIMNQIITQKEVFYSYFGAQATTLGDGAQSVVVINAVEPNSPAQQAGLQLGDRVLSINGEATRDAIAFLAKVNSLEPGAQVLLEVARNSRLIRINITLGSRSANSGALGQ